MPKRIEWRKYSVELAISDGFKIKAVPIMIETIVAFAKALAALLASVGIDPSHLFAGLSGAFTRTVIQGKRLTWEIISGSFVGALCAIYLSPMIGRWMGLELTDIAVNNGLAFAIGMIGLSLAEGLVRIAQRWANNPKLPRSMDAEGLADAVNQDRPIEPIRSYERMENQDE